MWKLIKQKSFKISTIGKEIFFPGLNFKYFYDKSLWKYLFQLTNQNQHNPLFCCGKRYTTVSCQPMTVDRSTGQRVVVMGQLIGVQIPTYLHFWKLFIMTSNSEITEFDKVLTMYHGTTIENAITIRSTGFKASDGRGARTEPSRKKGSTVHR